MNADFLDAHHRHWTDAEKLFLTQRWANADHLYGMAAECGLKRLMLAFGMPYDTMKDRPVKEQDMKHVDRIWARFESYRCGHVLGAGYVLSGIANPFVDWNVSQRYAHQSHFDQTRTENHRAGAGTVRALVLKAEYEGRLLT